VAAPGQHGTATSPAYTAAASAGPDRYQPTRPCAL